MPEASATHQIEIMVQIGKIVFSADDIIYVPIVQIEAIRLNNMLALVNQSGENTVADIPAVSFSLQQIPLKIHPKKNVES